MLFFSANDGENGEELWSSNGTEAGTVMVKDIFTGTNGDQPNSSFPGLFVAKDDLLFFVANDGESGAELWMSDGSESGTEMVADINAGADNAFTNTSQMVLLDDLLLFTANDGTSGVELWSSDGSESGTQIVFMLRPRELFSGDRGEALIATFGPAAIATRKWIKAATDLEPSQIRRLDVMFGESVRMSPLLAMVGPTNTQPSVTRTGGVRHNPRATLQAARTFGT